MNLIKKDFNEVPGQKGNNPKERRQDRSGKHRFFRDLNRDFTCKVMLEGQNRRHHSEIV